MKGLKISIFLMTCLWSFSMTAQTGLPYKPYEPKVWRNIKPLWYHTIYCPKSIDVTRDGYNNLFNNFSLKPIINDKHIFVNYQLYLSYPSTLRSDWFVGAFLEKLDWQTGKKMYDIYYQVDRDSITNRQEAIIYWEEDSQNINLFTLKKKSPIGIIDNYDLLNGGTAPSKMANRIYDSDDGKFTYYRNPDINDTLIPDLDIKMTTKIGFSQYLRKEKNLFEVLSVNLSSDYMRYYYTREYIDTIGHIVVQRDSFIVGSGNSNYHIQKLSDDHYVIANPDSNGVKFYHLDRDFKLKNLYKSPDVGYMKGLRAQHFSDKHVVFKRNIGTQFEPIYEVLRFDLYGNLKNKVNYDNLGSYLVSVICLDCDSDSTFHILSTKRYTHGIEKRLTFVVLKGDRDGTFKIVREELQEDHLRYTYPYNAFKMLNGNYVLLFEEHAYKLSVGNDDPNARAFSLAMFTPKELGLEQTVSTQEIQSKNYQISPNPVTDRLKVTFGNSYSGDIRVTDLQGRVLIDKKCRDCKEVEIDVENLMPAMYTISFIDDKGINQIERFVKM